MKKMKKWTSFMMMLFAWILLSATAYAAENESSEDKILAPYFVIQGSGDASVDYFPLKETNVTSAINGVIAETYVTQVYKNEGEKPINASYVFPSSTGVAVHGMKMQIGNNVVTAKIKEREEAKQEYEEAKSEGKSASLLEQQRPNVFTMDVANILPGDDVEIELHYTELISVEDGAYEFIFPTVVGPRYAEPSAEKNGKQNSGSTDAFVETPYLPNGDTPDSQYNITVHLSTGVPIVDLNCKSHEINITKKNDSTAVVTLANPADYSGNRDFILKYKLTGEELQSGLVLTKGTAAVDAVKAEAGSEPTEKDKTNTDATGKSGAENPQDNFFMLTIQPPEKYTPEEIPPREYIFVLDVSGSMRGYPLNTAKKLIQDLITGLKETDTFNLILFSGTSLQLAKESLPATSDIVKSALRLIQEQVGGGGTSLSMAMEQAIAIPKDENFARSIVVITDGYVSGEQNVFDIMNQNMDTTNFFAFGIGSSVNEYLIKGIANIGLGEFFIVTDEADAAECAGKFRTYIEAPLLTDISISYDGFEVYDVEPSIPSTLFAAKPIVLFGKWKGEPLGTIRITGKTGQKEYQKEISVADNKALGEGSAIRYLWARNRLERLMDYGYSKDSPDVKEEVTQIGLDYSIMTPYTSFVAVIDVIRNPEKESTDVDQALPLPLQVSNLAVGGGYRAYSEPNAIISIALIGCMILFNVLHRRKKYRKQQARQTA